MQTQFERLTDDQWEVIKHFLDWQRKRELDLREVFDAILYVTRTGTQWRNLHETNFPAWTAVYYYFDKWKKKGVLERINLALNQLERIAVGREAAPSLGSVDSQSVKLAPMIHEDRGIDGNKKINGRKRHILVDTLGRIYAVCVGAANVHDAPGGMPLLDQAGAQGDRLITILGDNAYRKRFADAALERGIIVEIPERPEGTRGFAVEAKRWVVERSFAWLNFYRRLAVDREYTVESSACFVLLANISMILGKSEIFTN